MGGSRHSSSTNTNYNYNPDLVKAAKIKAKGDVERLKLEGENITLRKEATKELMETNARMEEFLIYAKIEGMKQVHENLLKMTKELNLLGEQRLALLENMSGDSLKRMNDYYYEFIKRIEQDTTEFQTKEVPQLYKTVEQFDRDSPVYERFLNKIDERISDFAANQNENVKHFRLQQDKMFTSNLELKKQISTNIDKLVENRLEHLQLAVDTEYKKLKIGKESAQLQLDGEIKKLGVE